MRESCLFCQGEVQVNWFTGELVSRDGSPACTVGEAVLAMFPAVKGSPVVYHGSLTAHHGTATVLGQEPYGDRYVLRTPDGVVLANVRRSSFTVRVEHERYRSESFGMS